MILAIIILPEEVQLVPRPRPVEGDQVAQRAHFDAPGVERLGMDEDIIIIISSSHSSSSSLPSSIITKHVMIIIIISSSSLISNYHQ